MFRKTIIIRGLVLLLTIGLLASLAWAGLQIAEEKGKEGQVKPAAKETQTTTKESSLTTKEPLPVKENPPYETSTITKTDEISKKEFFERLKQKQIGLQEIERLLSERKIYRNEKYGFQFEYPAIYDKLPLEKGGINKLEDSVILAEGFVSVSVKDAEGLSLSDYIKKNYPDENLKVRPLSDYIKKYSRLKIDLKNRNIEEDKAVIIRSDAAYRGYWEATLILKNGKVYRIDWLHKFTNLDLFLKRQYPELEIITAAEAYDLIRDTFSFIGK